MSPFSDGKERTLRANLSHALPDVLMVKDVCDAVSRTHRASFYVSEILNIYIRYQLENNLSCPSWVFDGNQLIKVFQSVTHNQRRQRQTYHEHLDCIKDVIPPFESVDGAGLTQVFQYVCNNMATVASTNVWFHFRSRIFSHVKLYHRVDQVTFKAMSKHEKTQHKLQLHRIASDLCSSESSGWTSESTYHDWIRDEQMRLGLADHVKHVHDKSDNRTNDSFIKYISKQPQLVMKAMYLMLKDRESR